MCEAAWGGRVFRSWAATDTHLLTEAWVPAPPALRGFMDGGHVASLALGIMLTPRSAGEARVG